MKNIIFLFICLILISCNKLEEGTIIEKKYEPARTYVMLMPMIIFTGKSTTTIMIPYVIYDNEDFIIKVKGYDNEGKYREENFYISKIEYDKLNVGQYICVKGKCTEDNNNKKVRK